MSEFKAQILGILIVISVFGILLTAYKSMSSNTIDNVSNQVSSILNTK